MILLNVVGSQEELVTPSEIHFAQQIFTGYLLIGSIFVIMRFTKISGHMAYPPRDYLFAIINDLLKSFSSTLICSHYVPGPLPGGRSTDMNEIQTLISKILTSSRKGVFDEDPKSGITKYRSWWKERLLWINHGETVVSDSDLKTV